MARREPKIEALDPDGLALIADPSLLQQPADHLYRFPDAGQGFAIGHAVLGFDLHLVARPDAKDESSACQLSRVGAAMAIVGAVRTKTLVILVPSRMREV